MGAALIQGNKPLEMSGTYCRTAISEMEVVAAALEIRCLAIRTRIELHSDPEYLIYGIRALDLGLRRSERLVTA